MLDKKVLDTLDSSPRSLLNPSVISDYSSAPTRVVSTSQSISSTPVSKSTSRSISSALMAERKQKGLCFWCGAKYHVGHKCVNSQLYQFLLKPLSDSEAEEFQECSDRLEESSPEDEPSKSPMISLHALNGLQGHNRVRVATRVGSNWAIILVDLGSTHNFINARMVNRLLLPVMHQEQLKVSVVNGSCLFTKGMCKGVPWEVQNYRFETNFMVFPLKGCNMV